MHDGPRLILPEPSRKRKRRKKRRRKSTQPSLPPGYHEELRTLTIEKNDTFDILCRVKNELRKDPANVELQKDCEFMQEEYDEHLQQLRDLRGYTT